MHSNWQKQFEVLTMLFHVCGLIIYKKYFVLTSNNVLYKKIKRKEKESLQISVILKMNSKFNHKHQI